jgi:hypothetical protein
MKSATKFTEKNIYVAEFPHMGKIVKYNKIYCDKEDLSINELSWQKRGMQETATGYGNKLTTRYMVNFEGRDYRVYSRCFSNNGTCYIITKKHGEIVIDSI